MFQHSFPQPEVLEEEDEEENEQVNGRSDAPDAKSGAAPATQIPQGSKQRDYGITSNEDEEFVDAPSEPEEDLADVEPELDHTDLKKTRRSSTKSFVTASESRPPKAASNGTSSKEQDQASASQLSTGQEENGQKTLGKRPVSTVESSNGMPGGSTIGQPSVDAASTSSLLRKTDTSKTQAEPDTKPPARGILARATKRSHTSSDELGQARLAVSRTKSSLRNLVKFDLPEDSKRASMHLKAKAAQMTVARASTRLRRHKLKDGLVLKMERMLVRVDAAGKDVPEDFDENGNQKIDSRVKDKWREYMVVCRQSISDDADFVLQMYKTRVSHVYCVSFEIVF
jgi:hypothetical protein